MSKKMLLECCVDCAESAVEAAQGGADRLELCANLMIGGTTPSLSLLRQVKGLVEIPVNVLLRPRFGDFCYTQWEYEQLLEDVDAYTRAGADGVVIGVLLPDGELDCQRMQGLIARANGKKITLHRAFDVCADPYRALEQSEELGVDTILTSGQKNSSLEGAQLLAELVERARGGKVDIMVGSGVKSSNLEELVRRTGACSYHMSGKTTLDSPMQFRRPEVNMGLPLLSEYDIWRTDREEVRRAAEILRAAER